jgi:tetratricopeptide (TPR) repeat protein
VPGWHKAIEKLAAKDRENFVIVGIIQEQHPERCRLFAQWKELDWPILCDPVNALGLRAVPVTIAIDEFGVVRDTRPEAKRFVDTFLRKQFSKPESEPVFSDPVRPDMVALWQATVARPSPATFQTYGDSILLWQSIDEIDLAIAAYRSGVELDPKNAPLLFRLGVALRKRCESAQRQPGDFGEAVSNWTAALEIDPNHYIYRRRIQQYGPRLEKPYPFYDWISEAQSQIAARGESPILLRVTPSGAEIASPRKQFPAEDSDSATPPDPEGKIQRSENRILVSTVIVPQRIAAGTTARVHVEFRLAESKVERQIKWNNEAESMLVWIETPSGWIADEQLLKITAPEMAESQENRSIEFEIQAPDDFQKPQTLTGYALVNVCEQQGQCLYVRCDFRVQLIPAD